MPAEKTFDSEALLEQIDGFQLSCCQDNLIKEPTLILEVHGFSGIDGRGSYYLNPCLSEKLNALFQIVFPASEIGSQTQESSMWAGWRERLSLIVYWFHLGPRNFKSAKAQTLSLLRGEGCEA
jgi:hypothetical protein